LEVKKIHIPDIAEVTKAAQCIKEIVTETPLMQSITYSKKYNAEIFLKREDVQQVRSYKIRGAFYKISSLTPEEKEKGVVCVSAGNHAQGVAFACAYLQISGTIYMPTPTPKQKIEQVKMFGGTWVTVILEGDTFDDAFAKAKQHCTTQEKTFVHPFDDEKIIQGQATVGLEMINQARKQLDYVFVPIGGGGLAAGLSAVFHQLSPETKIIGVEPQGAPAMQQSIAKKRKIALSEIDKFVDGAALKQVGDLNFEICNELLEKVITVDEGKVCQTILDLYNRDAIVVEPAGALTLSALDQYADAIIGKNVACVISGSNNDIARTAEIKERALLYQGLKHYFIIRFPQRAGALKEFVVEVLGPQDDITFFEYSKKTSREDGPAVVGIQLQNAVDLQPLIRRMQQHNFFGDYLNDKPDLFQFLI